MKSTIQDCVGLQSNLRLRPPLYTGYFFVVPVDKKSIHWLLTSWPLYNGHFLLRGEGDPQGGHCREVELYMVSSWYLRSSSWSVTPRATRAMMMTVPVFRAVTWTVTPRATNLRDIDKHSISSIFGQIWIVIPQWPVKSFWLWCHQDTCNTTWPKSENRALTEYGKAFFVNVNPNVLFGS